MESEKLGTCEARHSHDGFKPHVAYQGCVNWREQPQGEATSNFVNWADGTCRNCGKPKFGPWSTICTADLGKVQEMYCQCVEMFSSSATAGTAREFLDNYQDAWVLSISERGKNAIAAVCEAYAAQKVSQEREARERAEKALREMADCPAEIDSEGRRVLRVSQADWKLALASLKSSEEAK